MLRLLAKCLPGNTQPICGIDLSTAIHRQLRKVPSKEKVMESSHPEIAERLPGAVADDEAGAIVLEGPWGGETASGTSAP